MALLRVGVGWSRLRSELMALRRLDQAEDRRNRGAGSRHAGRDVQAVAARAYSMFMQVNVRLTTRRNVPMLRRSGGASRVRGSA